MEPISSLTPITPAAAAAPSGGATVSAARVTGDTGTSPTQFRIQQIQDRVIVSVIDGTTGQVVQQISSEVWLRVARMISAAPAQTFSANG